MNMFAGAISADDGGAYRLQLPGFELTLPARFHGWLDEYGGKSCVIWGIRPEAIRLVAEAGENTISGEVELVEALGSRDLIFVRAAEQLFGVIVDAQESLAVGESCRLHFAGAQMHLFDAASERSLLNGGVAEDVVIPPVDISNERIIGNAVNQTRMRLFEYFAA